MANTYLHDIPSIHAINPGLPALHATLDLDRGIIAGQPLNQQDLDHARYVAMAFKGLKNPPSFYLSRHRFWK